MTFERKELQEIVDTDINVLEEKGKTYGDSWKKRGGIGAFMMLARKWDRIENQCAAEGYDIFTCNPCEKDGLLDDIQDLRRYLILVEDEITRPKNLPVVWENSGEPLSNGYVNQE